MKPLERATPIPPKWTAFAAQCMKHGLDMERAREIYEQESRWPMWMNHMYVVTVIEHAGGVTQLSIRRRDRAAARDWRHFQQIKNQLCGAEREGVELYPAEARLVDCANQYHIWVLPAGDTIPLGYPTGYRSYDVGGEAGFPFQQRPEGA